MKESFPADLGPNETENNIQNTPRVNPEDIVTVVVDKSDLIQPISVFEERYGKKDAQTLEQKKAELEKLEELEASAKEAFRIADSYRDKGDDALMGAYNNQGSEYREQIRQVIAEGFDTESPDAFANTLNVIDMYINMLKKEIESAENPQE